MEFYRQIESGFAADELQRRLRIDSLAECCASIDRVLDSTDGHGEIYCLWGQFRVNRELIRDGIRFTLPGCPNALAWTLTAHREEEAAPLVRIHCTINQAQHDPDFIASIETFIDDWCDGIAALSARQACDR